MVDVLKEETFRIDEPILVPQLKLINEEGDSLNSSFWEWQNINPLRNSTARLNSKYRYWMCNNHESNLVRS